MNTPETPSNPPTPPPVTPPSPPTPPPDIDAIINKFLDKAEKFIDTSDPDPKAVCSLGWLVLKIKKFQTERGPSPAAKPAGLTPETIRLLEERGKML